MLSIKSKLCCWLMLLIVVDAHLRCHDSMQKKLHLNLALTDPQIQNSTFNTCNFIVSSTCSFFLSCNGYTGYNRIIGLIGLVFRVGHMLRICCFKFQDYAVSSYLAINIFSTNYDEARSKFAKCAEGKNRCMVSTIILI